jgi:hypothetical protein
MGLSYSKLLIVSAITGAFIIVALEFINRHQIPCMCDMALLLTSTIRIVHIAQALIVPNPAEYLRNLRLAIVEPSHRTA